MTENSKQQKTVSETVQAQSDLNNHTEDNTSTKLTKPFYKSVKFYLYLTSIIVLVFVTLWAVNIFSVYKQAVIYKKSYDVVQEEKKFCESIKGTSQPKSVFDYCERFELKFKDLETTK